jgi:hypothetical protein
MQAIVSLGAMLAVALLAWRGAVGGDAALAFYSAVLGYVFGRTVTTVNGRRNGNGALPKPPTPPPA